MKRTSLLLILLAGLMCVAESRLQAAVFIKFDDINGESTDAAHPEWSELLAMDFSIVREPETGSTRFRPAVAMSFNCVKELDKSSPKLMEAIAKGLLIPTVTIHFTKSTGDGSHTYLEYELTNVLISSYSTSGSSDGTRPVESLSLNYEEIKVTYHEGDGQGGPGGTVDYTWNIAGNEGAL